MPNYRVRPSPGADESSNALSVALNKWFTDYGPSDIFVTCENCYHMTEAPLAAYCALYQMTPPATVICAGCPSHKDKAEVPF